MANLPFKMVLETDIEKYRHDTFWTKEPETIAWIDSFEDDAMFFDVGANIGIYSLYCAVMHSKGEVWAFEPDNNNFERLCDNVRLNEFYHVMPWHRAISDTNEKTVFYEIFDQIGSSGGQILKRPEEFISKHDILARTVDIMALLAMGFFRRPQYIKIDIDGQELNVVKGMSETIKNPALKSVLIEIDQTDPGKVSQITLAFLDAGFTVNNRFNQMRPHSTERREREGINVRNVVFTK